MKKGLWIPIIGLCICTLAFAVGVTGEAAAGFTLEQYHNADAKFIGTGIITSVDEGIRILDLDGGEIQAYDGLSASWLYVQEDTSGGWNVAYSNHENETHILRLSSDYGMIDDRIALTTDTLAIDPILVRADGGWLLTYTEIDGTINNPDPEGENGTYTVKLYRSDDLENWEFVTDVIQRDQNLEDGDIRYVDGVLYFFFELEDYDKGPSAICVMTSEDGGETWSEVQELLPAAADNEMACCDPTETGWRLYVSSDYACVGESYQGASVYYADYTPDLETVQEYRLSGMPDNEAVRLYDVKEIDGQLYFLFARNFLTDCDLLLRAVDGEEE